MAVSVLRTLTSPTHVTVSPGIQLPARLPCSSTSTVLILSASTALPSGLKSCVTSSYSGDWHIYDRALLQITARGHVPLCNACGMHVLGSQRGRVAYLQPDPLPGNSVCRVQDWREASAAAPLAACARASCCAIREAAPLAAAASGARKLHAQDQPPDCARPCDNAPDCDQPSCIQVQGISASLEPAQVDQMHGPEPVETVTHPATVCMHARRRAVLSRAWA